MTDLFHPLQYPTENGGSNAPPTTEAILEERNIGILCTQPLGEPNLQWLMAILGTPRQGILVVLPLQQSSQHPPCWHQSKNSARSET